MTAEISTKPMEREDFLKKIFSMYKKTFDDRNSSVWLEAYKKVLPLNADFEVLFNRLVFEYSGTTAPKPAWFADKITFKYSPVNSDYVGKAWKNTVYGIKNGVEYEFGVEINSSYFETQKALLQKGFTIKEKERE